MSVAMEGRGERATYEYGVDPVLRACLNGPVKVLEA